MENLRNIKKKYSLSDLAIVPASLSNVNSRNEVKTTYENGMSPFFVAPMDTVVDLNNLSKFYDLNLNVCLPRGIEYSDLTKTNFVSYGLDEFIEKYCVEPVLYGSGVMGNVLIDIANGHMKKLYDACKIAKSIWGDALNLMVGNIANPKTYHEFAEIGVDYIRVNIGSGTVCTTTTHTNVHYPTASLIMECRAIKDKYNYKTKIIADGGISSTADVNTALACGADFVMIGSLFNRTYEACGQAYIFKRIPVLNSMIPFLKKLGLSIKRKYRGMSTTAVQKAWKKKTIRPSEGIHIYNEVSFSLESLVSDLNHRLATAMSYTGDFTLETFVSGETELVEKTNDTINRINK